MLHTFPTQWVSEWVYMLSYLEADIWGGGWKSWGRAVTPTSTPKTTQSDCHKTILVWLSPTTLLSILHCNLFHNYFLGVCSTNLKIQGQVQPNGVSCLPLTTLTHSLTHTHCLSHSGSLSLSLSLSLSHTHTQWEGETGKLNQIT